MNRLLLYIQGGDIFPVINTLLGVILILLMAYFATRFIAKRYASVSGSSDMVKIVERIALAQDKFLVIVQVAEKYMLLGVTSGSIQKICDINEDDVDKYLHSSAVQGRDFTDILAWANQKLGKTKDTEENHGSDTKGKTSDEM